MRLIAHIITIVFALTFPAQHAFGQNFVVPKGAATVEEVPSIFHGTWRITGSFHAYEVVGPSEFIGKTITITAKGYQLDTTGGYSYEKTDEYRVNKVICEPTQIHKTIWADVWYFNYAKNHGKYKGLSVPHHLRNNYTKVTDYSLECPSPNTHPFTRATHHIILRHYEPSDGFIVFLTKWGPEFLLEPVKK